MLLKKGANPNLLTSDENGHTPLCGLSVYSPKSCWLTRLRMHRYMVVGHEASGLELLATLLAHKADVNIPAKKGKATPLHYTCMEDLIEARLCFCSGVALSEHIADPGCRRR